MFSNCRKHQWQRGVRGDQALPRDVVRTKAGWVGNVLIWPAGLHAAAALYHHFWRRDRVLLRMLPWVG